MGRVLPARARRQQRRQRKPHLWWSRTALRLMSDGRRRVGLGRPMQLSRGRVGYERRRMAGSRQHRNCQQIRTHEHAHSQGNSDDHAHPSSGGVLQRYPALPGQACERQPQHVQEQLSDTFR